jgi:hypothetical protein
MNPRPENATLTAALDEAFLARVHKASLFMAGLVGLIAAVSTLGGNWALGFMGCAIWSIANLWTLERVVRGQLRPGRRDPIALAIGLLVKLPVLYALLVVFLFFGKFPASAVLIGVAVPLVVIILKVAGRMLALRMRSSDAGVPQARS